MKKLIITLLAAAALAVGAPTTASADQPSNPGCVGEGVSGVARGGVGGQTLGEFVSGVARADDSHPGLGQDFVPFVKGLFCGP